ncbi:MAG: glycosyltransferase family 1 protein [Candidatus Saccharimonadales bacterium]
MKKIAIDARELRTSTGRYIERLLHYLQKIDTNNEYVVLLKPVDIKAWSPTNSHFTKIECPYPEFSFGEQIGMQKMLDELKPDLVHFGMTQQPVRYKGKVVTTIHDLTTTRFRNPSKNPLVFVTKQQIYKWVVKRVAQKSDRIIVPTDYVKKDVADYCGVKFNKIVVTPEAADIITASVEPIAKLMNRQFLLYVGRPQPHKNLNRLMLAFKTVARTHPDLQLVLAGKFNSNYQLLSDFAKKNTIRRVTFTDFVSEGELRWLYEHASAYVFPSLSEGFGLPGLEAMLYNLPLVSSSATCLPEVYKDAAVYFDPLNVQDITNKINYVLDNPELAQKLTIKGEKVVESYSWQRMAEQTLQVYSEVLSGS